MSVLEKVKTIPGAILASVISCIGAAWLFVGTGWWESMRSAISSHTTPELLLNTLALSALTLLCCLIVLLTALFKIRKLESRWQKYPIIHKAVYGYDQDWIEVTDAVRAKIHNGVLTVTAGNDLGGDPHYGHGKNLIIDYSVNGKIFKENIPEQVSVTLPKK